MIPDEMQFRPLESGDLPLIASWREEAVSDQWLDLRDWPAAALRLARTDPQRRIFAVLLEGQLAALLDTEMDGAGSCAVALAVAPHLRRKGVARAILASLPQLPELHDARRFCAEVDRSNEAAYALFLKAGFKRSGQSSEPGFDRLLLEPQIS